MCTQINILMCMHIHSWSWPLFTFCFLPIICYFLFLHIYFLLFCQSPRTPPPIIISCLLLAVLWLTWESIDYMKDFLKCLHAGHVWSFCSFFIPPLFFFYAFENELLLGKELLLRMVFIHFFHFPITFLEYGLKKWKEHHASSSQWKSWSIRFPCS